MKLKYEINLVSLGILVAVASAIALAGVTAINQVTHDLNRKVMSNEVKNIVSDIRSAHQVLKDSGVDGVVSYVDRAKRDLLQEFRKYGFGRTGRIWIVEPPDRFALHGETSPRDIVDPECLSEMIREKSGDLTCSNTAKHHLFSFDTYPEWNWIIALSVETAEILQARHRFLRNVVIILLASLIIGTLLFLWFTDRLVRPVRQLAAAAASVSRGEWDAPLPALKGEGEIAQLARTFRSMSQKLAETYRSLQENLDQVARSREELHQSRERFRSLVETTSDWVWEVDENGVYTYVSPRVLDLLGYEPAEVLGRTPMDLMPPDQAERVAAFYADIVRSTSGFSALENCNRRKDGQLVVLESSGIPFFDGDGVFRGYRGIDRDITERKRSEDAFRNLILNAPIGIYIVQDGRFKLVNPGVLEITGYGEQELIGEDALGSLSPELVEMAKSSDAHALKGEHPLPFELQITTKSGETRWVMQTVTPTRHDGRVAALGYFIDVTDRKRLEDELFQSHKMQAIGRLAGGVAHDFNNLLTAVLGYTDLILDRVGDDEQLRGDVEQIKKAGERAASLTSQLLAFSRRQVMRPKHLDLNAAVKDMEQMLRRLIGEDIELASMLDPDVAPVFADHTQIGQVIMNLAVNARDAMPTGGKLTIETSNSFLGDAYALRHPEVAPGPYVMLAVSDTGQGMDDEIRAHIFEPFYTTKEKGKGTGLGLATVYGIIKQSNGHVSVYSEQGRGSTFKVYLPVAQGPGESEEDTSRAAGIPGGSETVLLVEDDELVRNLTSEILRRSGYRVLEASNGGDALQICHGRDSGVHLVVTDVIMPGMSGRELADQLAVLHPDIKVLFISGYTENAIVHHGVLQPGLAFLQKPFTAAALARKVREVLDTRGTAPGMESPEASPV